MSSSTRVKVKQDDLRRLMKERRENVRAKAQKIDSPLAKYNEYGKLYCIVCNVQIKSEALWPHHIIGKIHKENIQRKRKHSVVNRTNGENSVERVNTVEVLTEKKVSQVEQPSVHKSESNRSSSKLNSLDQYSSSDDEDKLSAESPTSKKDLPADFFDTQHSLPSAATTSDSATPPEPKKQKTDPLCSSAQSLPEGFFDNPVLDAKVRNIEYKDPIEEEWEKFQKTIQEETNFSKTIMEEDVAESTVERNLEQIDQQIHHWGTVKHLQSKFEEECLKTVVKQKEKDLSDSDDDDQLDDLLDWRSKGVRT